MNSFEWFSFTINDWNPWLVLPSDFKMLICPIVALDDINIVPGGNNFAELFLSPFSLIFLLLESTYLSLPTSLGVNQFIEPFQ